MAGDSNLALSIFDYALDLSLRSLPYQEKPKPKSKKETIRVATIQPVAVCKSVSVSSHNKLMLYRTRKVTASPINNLDFLMACLFECVSFPVRKTKFHCCICVMIRLVDQQ